MRYTISGISRYQVRRDKPLDNHDVKPSAVKARVFLVHADLAKTVFETERATGLVEKKNARQEFPQPQSLRLGDETSEQ